MFIQYQAKLLNDWHPIAHLKQLQLDKVIPYHLLHPFYKQQKQDGTKAMQSGTSLVGALK